MSCEYLLPIALGADDEVQSVHHLHLEPLPRLIGDARTFVSEHAPPLGRETRDALLLLTSELVTNAVIHARTELVVGVTTTARHVLVTVHDLELRSATKRLPEACADSAPGEAREGGRGLGLVEALAVRSDVVPHPRGGKTAWFLLDRDVEPADS